MKYFHCTDSPIELRGLAGNSGEGRFWRVDSSVMDGMPDAVKQLGRRNTGGRVRFATDSRRVYVRVILSTLALDINFSPAGSAGADAYSGTGERQRYIGRVFPKNFSDSDRDNSEILEKSGELETVTINMPRNELVSDIIVGIDDGARMEPPEQYKYDKPIVFYGSSITEGCCAERPGCAYVSMLARRLDADYRNFGFSGAAKGETAVAEYISGLEMSAFVCDYDHNAPSVEHLEQTHEKFFKIVRAAQPELPIIITTAPNFEDLPDARRRRDVIRRTFDHAREDGDSRVYFIDGETLFGAEGRENCTIDRLHPNSIGFARMADAMYPVLKAALGGQRV